MSGTEGGPPAQQPLIMRPTQSPVVRYEAMCRAIAEAHSIDEVKLIRDEAAAMLEWARIAKNRVAERQCCEIRIRAEREWAKRYAAGDKATATRGQLSGRDMSGPIIATGPEDAAKTLAEYGVSYKQSSDWQKLAAMPDGDFEAALAGLEMPTLGAVLTRHNHRTQGTGDNEWTPPEAPIEAARAVFGGVIDLDPASHAAAQLHIQAQRFYTQAEDGLAQEWRGRVWLNPPYAWPTIEHFIDKLAEQVAAGNTTEAIVLTNNSSDTAWFHKALGLAAALCLARGRINFLDRDGCGGSPPSQGQAFFYCGPHIARFWDAFRRFGRIVYPDPED